MKIEVGTYVVFVFDKEFKLYQVEKIHPDNSVGMIELETGRRTGTWITQLRPYYLQKDTQLYVGRMGVYRIKTIHYRHQYNMGYVAEVYNHRPGIGEMVERTLKEIEEDFKQYVDKM